MALSRSISSKGFISQRTTQDLSTGALQYVNNATTIDRFTGDGTTVTFTLSASPTVANTMVFVSGVYQEKNTYVISGNQIIFTQAPPAPSTAGVANIEVLSGTALSSASSGSGTGSGLKNYLTTYNGNPGNGNFETKTTTGWSLFNTTLTSLIPTGSITAGAASITGFTVNTSSPLAGASSLQTSGTFASGQGFLSDAFTIDTEDQAKVLGFNFFYSVTANVTNGNFSGTSSNTFAVYIYDVTNSAWIQPAGVYNLVQNSGVGRAAGTFQTSFNGTQYRFAIVCINTASGSLTLEWDDFFVGPQLSVNAPAVSDWIAYTPTGTWTVNSTYTGKWRRIGDSMEIMTRTALSGAPNSANFSVYLPSGYTIDLTKLTSPTRSVLGTAVAVSNGSNYEGNVFCPGANNVVNVIGSTSSAGPWSQSNPNTFQNGDEITTCFTVPITGWSSNSVMSQDTDTRVVAMYATAPSLSVASSSTNPIVFPTVISDTHGAYNNTTGLYTIPVSGYYDISSGVSFLGTASAQSGSYALRINGVNSTTYVGGIQTTVNLTLNYPMTISFKAVYFAAGTTVGLVSNNGSNTINAGVLVPYFSIARVSGPAVIAATESVNARYHTSSTQSIPNASNTALSLLTVKDFDTHNSFNTSNATYTVPVSGKYQVSAQIASNSPNTATAIDQQFTLIVTRNGIAVSSNGVFASSTSASITYVAQVNDIVQCNAGDTIQLLAFNTIGGSSITIGSALSGVWFAINRVGN